MTADADRSLRRWKWIAGLSLVACAVLLVACAVLALAPRPARLSDDRLLGTWRSDADRTIAGLREQRPVDEKQEAALRTMFGKLRVTYGEKTYTAEMDGGDDIDPVSGTRARQAIRRDP